MSDTAYTRYRPARKVTARNGQVEEAEYADNVYDEVAEDEVLAEPMGVFATPARTAAIVISVLLLFAIVGVAAWLLGQKAHTSGSSPNVVLLPNGAGSTGQNSEAPRVGALAPDFDLVDVKSGKPLRLSSLRGKPAFVNFWGTWCPPCRAEMPEMQKLYDKVKDQVAFVGVSMGPRDEPAGVAQFVKLNSYTWTFVHDGDSAVMARYEVTGIPSSYFIDKTGVIRAINVGGTDAATMESKLQLAEQ